MDTDEQPKIEVDVTLELQDYLRVTYWSLFRKWAIKGFFILSVFMIVAFIFTFAQRRDASSFSMLILPTLFLLIVISVYFNSKKNLASNKSMQGNIHYTFSNQGISSVGESSSGQSDWNNIINAYETKHNFLLFASLSIVQIIPKRCFQNAESIVEFKQMLISKIGSKAKLK